MIGSLDDPVTVIVYSYFEIFHELEGVWMDVSESSSVIVCRTGAFVARDSLY